MTSHWWTMRWQNILRTLFAPLLLAAAVVVADEIVLDEPNQATRTSQPLLLTSTQFKTPLVELYTSEGCSSCPPADRWLRQLGQSLTQHFTAVPLAFHVDYWNYLGWVDAYSQPAFTARQRQVAANNRQARIYTPEFLVDGREARGSERIVQFIEQANSQPAKASIQARVIKQHENRIAAHIEVNNRASPAQVYVALYESGITRKIAAGENRGKTLQHDFVVRHWSNAMNIGHGNQQTTVEIEIADDWRPAQLGFAVVVLERASGATVQSVRASLASLLAG